MVPIQGQTHESKGDFIFSIKPLKTPPNSRVNVPLNPFFYKLLAFIKLKGPSFKGLEYCISGVTDTFAKLCVKFPFREFGEKLVSCPHQYVYANNVLS